MISPLFNDSQYQGLRTMLNVSEARHEALASNVANVNTPGFKRRDLNPLFQQELQKAIEARDPTTIQEMRPKVDLDETTPSFRLDGNNVNLEREMVEMAKNGAQHEVSATLLAKRYQMLRLAITGEILIMSMSLIPGIETSGSALHAERTRMNVIANNIANASTTRDAQGNPYRRQVVVFETMLENQLGDHSIANGTAQDTPQVHVKEITDDQRPFKSVYMPGHPDADPQGMVRMPNVNVTEEMVDMITASRSIEANVQVITTAKQMVQRVLDISRR